MSKEFESWVYDQVVNGNSAIEVGSAKQGWDAAFVAGRALCGREMKGGGCEGRRDKGWMGPFADSQGDLRRHRSHTGGDNHLTLIDTM